MAEDDFQCDRISRRSHSVVKVTPKPGKRVFRTSLICICFSAFLVLVPSCGSKKRTPPQVLTPQLGSAMPQPQVSVPKRQTTESFEENALTKIGDCPTIRVLLKENFQSAILEGSNLGPFLTIKVKGGEIGLFDASKKLLHTGSGFSLKNLSGGHLKLDGELYRGVVEAFINPLQQPVIVNELCLEEYLRGVVPNELNPNLFPQTEAIKAQTVAARTFAFSHLRQNAKRGFDVYMDERSQVYKGVQSEKQLSNHVVQETRGLVATYRDHPIVAFYSSTCGGLTESYEAIFQKPAIPYLKGGVKCPDRSSPYHSWNEHIQIAKVQSRLEKWANVGRLKKIVSLKKSEAGRIVKMRFVGEKGEKVLRGQIIRFALGLKSNWVTDFTANHESSGYLVKLKVEGKGFGHGVGMCQIGAVELAKRGWTFQQILKHYYVGTGLKRYW